MSDVKRVTLTTISDVVKKGGGGGTSIGGPFGALDGASAMSSAFGGGPAFAGGGSHSPVGKESSAGSSGAGPEGGKSGSAKKHKTVRLELNLFEPTAESFPEFNFAKLVHEEQKRLKKAQKKHHDDANNGFLSDPELDNDVARMARELERKYGSGTAYAGKEKFARPSKLDYYDRGAGYDEEDSFIDNSEAYDELIPQEIETVGGGFYINSGQLEFKQLSNFERPDDVHRMPKPKKRALSTTSESSDDDEPPANAKKKAEERGQPPVAQSQPTAQASSEKPTAGNPEPPLQQQQLSEGENVNAAGNSGPEVAITTGDEKPRVNGHVAKKQKLAENGPLGAPKGVAGVEKDKAKSSTGTKATMDEGGKERANGVKPKVSTVTTQPAVAGGPTVALGTLPPVSKKDENENDGGVKLIKTTTVKDMLRAKRDSLRKMEQEKKGRSSGSSRVSSSEAEEDGDGGGDEDDEDEENDEDDDEDDEEDDEDEEMGEVSDKESNESGSEEDIGSESESSHAESTSEKDAAARAKVVTTTNGTGGEGERPVTVVPTEQQQQQKDKEKEKEKERKRKESKLPDELPESLRKVVETLKELAQTHAIGGKLNYFDSKVAEVLLQVDEGARAAGNSTRNAIFRHLEAQLSISRQSLQLKIKKIRIRKLEGRAKAALDQLEDTICDQMPLLLAKHELDCRKVAEQRAAQAAATAAAAGTNVLPPGGSDPATVNGEKPGPQTTTTAGSTPQIRNPKKRYSWNERTRDLLWELYCIRVESFAFLRPRNETEDDFVAEYLRNKVVPLWPKGWMRYEDLHKELDRRKKALAKSAPAATVGGPVPKKHPLVVLPPLTSPPSSAIDPSWMTSSGTPTTAMNGSTKATGTPSAGGGGKSGSSPGAIAAAPLTSQVPANLSPNGVSNKRGSSDHSISNIMNSPPLPPPPAGEKNRSQPTGRRSFDDDQLMLSPPNPAGSVVERDGTSAKRGLLVSPPDNRTSLSVADRPPWNSREDDSDSSIEIIGEYNVIGGSAHGPTAGAGVIHSAKSLIHSTPPTPTSTTTNVLPVLNKEKYKNLIAGKNKGHGSGGGNSPVGSTDTSPTGGVLIGPGKYSKHSPTGAGERMTPQQGTGGGSLSFTTPSGSTGSIGGGGIRHSDVTRMKESPSTPSIDLDVHQIMKDLKEYQELQQHHSAGSSRKADATTIPSQQQHDRPQKSKNAPIVVD